MPIKICDKIINIANHELSMKYTDNENRIKQLFYVHCSISCSSSRTNDHNISAVFHEDSSTVQCIAHSYQVLLTKLLRQKYS